MKDFTLIAFSILALTGQAAAEPIKCLAAGKTIYTDNPAKCEKGAVKPIGGNLLISKDVSPKNTAPASPQGLPHAIGAMPLPEGVSSEDVAAGWKTIMDARKQGSWQAPEIPSYAK